MENLHAYPKKETPARHNTITKRFEEILREISDDAWYLIGEWPDRLYIASGHASNLRERHKEFEFTAAREDKGSKLYARRTPPPTTVAPNFFNSGTP